MSAHFYTRITERGQVALVVATVMLAVSIAVIGTFASVGLAEGLAARTLQNSKQSYYAAEGALEYVTMKMKEDNSLLPTGNHTIISGANPVTANVTSVDAGAGTYYTATSKFGNAQRSVAYVAPGGVTFSMPFAAYAGYAGILFDSANARIAGNVSSFGSVVGKSATVANYNTITEGNVILAAHPIGVNADVKDVKAKNDDNPRTGLQADEAPCQASESGQPLPGGSNCIPWHNVSATQKIAQSFSVSRAGQPTKIEINMVRQNSPATGTYTIKIVGSKDTNSDGVADEPDANTVYAQGTLNQELVPLMGAGYGLVPVTLTPTEGKFLTPYNNSNPPYSSNEGPERSYWILFSTGVSAQNSQYYRLAATTCVTCDPSNANRAIYWGSTEAVSAGSTTKTQLQFRLYIGNTTNTLSKVKINDSDSCGKGYVTEADKIDTTPNQPPNQPGAIVYADTIALRDGSARLQSGCASGTVKVGPIDATDANASLKPPSDLEDPFYTPVITDTQIQQLIDTVESYPCNGQDGPNHNGTSYTYCKDGDDFADPINGETLVRPQIATLSPPLPTINIPGFVVPGNFIMDGTDQTIKIRGIIHVKGNLEIRGATGVAPDSPGCTVQVDESLGAKSATIIVDGRVTIQNKCVVKGSGDAEGRSHLIIIARGRDSGANAAVDVSESGYADMLIATRGTVYLHDSSVIDPRTHARAVAAPFIKIGGRGVIDTASYEYSELVVPADAFSYAGWGEVE